MMTKLQKWFYSLAAAAIGGFASAVDSSLALMIIAPDKFNIGAGLKTTLVTALILGVLTGAKCAFAYLKQSPLPAIAGDTAFFLNSQSQLTRKDIGLDP